MKFCSDRLVVIRDPCVGIKISIVFKYYFKKSMGHQSRQNGIQINEDIILFIIGGWCGLI